MKNLLLIFVLLLFSIQSFAGSCPDGSEPVKSISADGTYFVFNCGAQESSASLLETQNSKNSPISWVSGYKCGLLKNSSGAINPIIMYQLIVPITAAIVSIFLINL